MTMSSPTEQLVEDVAVRLLRGDRRCHQARRRDRRRGRARRCDRGHAERPPRRGAASPQSRTCRTTPIEEVVRILSRPPHPTLIQNNRWFHALLTDGVEVEYRDAKSGETRGGRARLVDFDNPAANDLLVVRQLSVAGASGKIIRPDLTVFLNGLPIAVIELKDPTDTQADLGVAIDQLDRYMQTAPDLFVPNLVLVVSDGMLTRVGSITSGRSRFMPWRPLARRRRRRADAGGADPGAVRAAGAGRLPAHLRHLRGGRARRDRQEDRRLPPVPRGAQGTRQRAGEPASRPRVKATVAAA